MTNPNLFPALCPTWNRTALYYHTGNPRHLNTKRVKHLASPVPPYSTYSRHAGRRRDGHGKPAKILRCPPVLPVQEVVNHLITSFCISGDVFFAFLGIAFAMLCNCLSFCIANSNNLTKRPPIFSS